MRASPLYTSDEQDISAVVFSSIDFLFKFLPIFFVIYMFAAEVSRQCDGY